MSLTAFIRKSNTPDIKDFFKTNFSILTKPRVEIKVPSLEPQDNSVIGMTYDLIFNDKIDQLNKVPNLRVEKIEDVIKSRDLTRHLESVEDLMKWDEDVNLYKRYHVIRRHPEKALENLEIIKRFQKTGRFTVNTAKAYLHIRNFHITSTPQLYKLHSGFIRTDSYEKSYVDQIIDLYKLTDWKLFKNCESSKRIKNSLLAAQIDFSKGDTIYDIKCTEKANLKRDELNQIVGYLLLSYINEGKESQYTRVGIYYARHGFWWKSEPYFGYSQKEFEVLSEEFKHLIEKYNLIEQAESFAEMQININKEELGFSVTKLKRRLKENNWTSDELKKIKEYYENRKIK